MEHPLSPAGDSAPSGSPEIPAPAPETRAAPEAPETAAPIPVENAPIPVENAPAETTAVPTTKKSAEPEPEISPTRQAVSVLLGFAFAAIVDLGVFVTRPYARTPMSVRANAMAVSAGYLLAIGAIAAAGVWAYRRFGPRSRVVAYGVLTAFSWAIGYVFYAEDLSGISDSLANRIPIHALRMGALTFGLSLSVPIALAVGRHAVRRWHWSLGLAEAASAVVLNGIEHDYPEIHLFITQSYPGVHLLIAVLAGVVASVSFARAPIPAALKPAATPRTGAVLAAVAAVWGALALVVQPSNAVQLDLQRYPGAALFPFLGALHAGVPGTPNVPEGKGPWFADRSALPAIPPTTAILPKDPIIILLGIDSMRADVLSNEKYREELPELFRIRDESVYFTNARSAGSSTAPSISSMFADVYYSQLYWTRTSGVDNSLVFPHEDQSPRFPALLTQAGVYTLNSDGTSWLVNQNGIVRGFEEEESQRRGDYARAQQLLTPVMSRLKERAALPQFYFVHMLDAHSPYTSAGKRATPFLGYIAELSRIDKQIQRLTKMLESNKRLLSRTCIIIMADHGEAFGEHGTQRHAVSLYDELLRVPLMVYLPGGKPRVVKDEVSTMDIAPTILDLMGVATPGRYMGQSLTGYLRGESPKLERPIAAEARLKRSMILPDGSKVIYDTKTHVVEIYDLARDPGEENNLYREGDPLSASRLGALNAFFEVHTLRRPGYVVPYRKW
ncbi:Choline-sulfatase [Minicystis rosea]|nr:Choline-sulfatase [Minicystis rosea]